MSYSRKFISQSGSIKISSLKWLLILAAVLLLAFLVYVLVKINQPLTTDASETLFVVEKGKSAAATGEDLESQQLISRSFFFRLYLRLVGKSEKIQAGSYLLSSNMSIQEIVSKLLGGEVVPDAVKLTVIEGWNINDIAAKLEELGVLTRAEFVAEVGEPRQGGAADFEADFEFLADLPANATLEGFLFPDTYFVSQEAAAETVAKKLLANFERKVIENEDFRLQNSELNFYETITLASMVEREVGRNVRRGTVLSEEEKNQIAEERRKVASVFLNRLERGMRLESDATVTYITGSKSPRATIAETRISSPYNTYQVIGLPPGPISNPSLDSILAVVEPADTDYLYFLTDESGRAYFAETFEQHQQNRERYLE